MKNIAIIGCGAAGMMAAIAAADNGHNVTIYEKNEKAGKKLFITGKGRCNITNASDIEVILNNIVTNKKFMYSSLYTMDNQMIIKMFESFDVPIKVERGNRVFPVSDKSSDVIRGLTDALRKRNVKIKYNTPVKNILIENDEIKGIQTQNEKEYYDAVIVATGGVSYSSTGSTGDGHKMAKQYGHKITELRPALVPLTVDENYAKELQGLSLKNVEVTIYNNNRKIYNDFGEMLFTHFGISGPLILSASSVIGKYIKDNRLVLTIDLKPAMSDKQLDERILRDFEKSINRDFKNSLDELLPKKMIPVIIEYTKISPFKKVNTITKEERNILVNALKRFTLTINGTRGFNEAIITQGGVSIKDINPATMESKLVKNLYFAGEVIDVDALTGGYNLQIAWSTGYLAGISIE